MYSLFSQRFFRFSSDFYTFLGADVISMLLDSDLMAGVTLIHGKNVFKRACLKLGMYRQ